MTAVLSLTPAADHVDPVQALVESHREKVSWEARCVALVADLIADDAHEDLGYRSMTPLLMDLLGISSRVARGMIRMARALAEMPASQAAFRRGELDVPRVRLLLSARDANPALFAEHEAALVDSMRGLSMRDASQALEYWRQQAALEATEEDAAARRARRRLHVSAVGGMVYLDGVLDPIAGQTVITALDALTDPGNLDPDDDRTAPQRRADALTGLCHEYLSGSDRPIQGNERPHVMVYVSIDALEGRVGRPCELDDAGVVTPESARRLACDAKVSRIITDGESQILDVGRATRVWPAGIRKAIVARDRGCVIPGCGAPARWCDIHHLDHWADGGRTSADKGILLCQSHHTGIHEGTVRLPQRDGPDAQPLIAATANPSR